VNLVKRAGNSLTEITTSVRKVADIVSEIAAASSEQASGIDQVSRAITNMDELTQQNAALVEETNAALHSAQIQVEELQQAVSFFKTGDAKFQAARVDLRAPKAPQSTTHLANVEPEQSTTLHEKLRQLAMKMASAHPVTPQTKTANAIVNADWKEF
jgi:methyl-accepting chemotaxis protein